MAITLAATAYFSLSFQYVMSFDEFREQEVKFQLFEKEKSTWFGLSKKVAQELLIYSKAGFFYPYQYGNYFYIYSREESKGRESIKWIEVQFRNRFADFNDTLAGLNSDKIKLLLHESDYILVTNHGYKKEFGLVASKELCAALTAKLQQAAFDSFETEEYV